MNTFCTSCGAANSGAGFCTSCGTATDASTQTVASPSAPVTETAWSNSEGSVAFDNPSLSPESGSDSSKKKLILIAAAVILFFGTGVGAFLAGKSSVDLEAERKTSYDQGFEAGDTAGYSRGDSAGYSRGNSAGYDRGYDSGKTAGCLDVFSFSDGTYDYVTPYNPNSYYSKYPGSYYMEKSDC
jgi:hypothetical protein